MPSKLKKALGAVKDQTSISLAKVSSNASSQLEVAVLKATTHDDVPINDKYVKEVLQLVSSNKAHAKACARAIGKRIGRTRNWIVALKSLMLVLRIFQDGDPYFPREVLHAMKRGAKILNLSGFRDDSNSSPWDFTSFVRTFGLYLDERLECFLTGKLQRRYTQEVSTSTLTYNRTNSWIARTGTNEPVRDMKPAMLLDKMLCWQRLLDRAIATRPTGEAKTNPLVLISLHAIVQESFEIYKDISDGLTHVLDSFFHLQYQNCATAFHTCMKAVKQFEELSGFYSLCKILGVGRSSEYPTVQAISEELIETLQEFLKDQSSFPSSVSTPTKQLRTGPDTPRHVTPRHSKQHSYGAMSDFSTTTDGLSDMTSEVGSQCTSLEDLINATETCGPTGPAISIDLETYPASQQDSALAIADTGSTRSLPGSCSVGDLMYLEDWTGVKEKTEKEEQEYYQSDQHEQKEKRAVDSSACKNWELVLAETISSSSSSSANLSQPLSGNKASTFNAFAEQPPSISPSPPSGNHTNTFNAFPEQPSSSPLSRNHANTFNAFPEQLPAISSSSSSTANLSQHLSGNNTNTFNAFPERGPVGHENPSTPSNTSTNGWELALSQPLSGDKANTFNAFPQQPPAPVENPSTPANTTPNGWELTLFKAAPPPQQPTPDIQLPPPNNHYNPFLLESMELPGLPTPQSPMSAPTFQATPTFSAQNPNDTPFPLQFEDDPFGTNAQISGDVFSNPSDQQNLRLQQQLWLQNQSKIIAKHRSQREVV